MSYSIGELARRTGLTVKTIRYYSDRGIVAPSHRNSAGHRRYAEDAIARLELVRTLRDLELDLSTVRRVVRREIALSEVAAVHAEALALQIRTLRMRHAILAAVAKHRSTPEELALMHRLAQLSAAERRHLIGEFLDSVFGADPAFDGIRCSLTPELPDDPEPEQIEAWAELAELSQDRELRAAMRRIAEQDVADQPPGVPRRGPVATVRDLAGPAVAAGVDPVSAAAVPVVAAVLRDYADVCGRPDGPDLRRRLRTRLETANDPRRERYLALLSVVNGWAPTESVAPALDWFLVASGASDS